MGFSVVRPDGAEGVLTAEHCSFGGNEIPDPSPTGVTLGASQNPLFTINVSGIDRQIHPIPSAHNGRAELDRGPSSTLSISRGMIARLPQNAAAYFYGQASTEVCGRHGAQFVRVTGYAADGRIQVQSPTTLLGGGRQPIRGDSGGPLYVGNSAAGILATVNTYTDPDQCSWSGKGSYARIDTQLVDSDYMLMEGNGNNFTGAGAYTPITPKRVNPDGWTLNADQVQSYTFSSGDVPSYAAAVMVNITTVPITGAGEVTAYPGFGYFSIPNDVRIVQLEPG